MQPQFRLLGPLQVEGAGAPVALGGPRSRRLLAMLLLHAREVVSTDRLVDAVWDEPPPSAEVTLRSHVAGLRRHLAGAGGNGLLVTCAPGYRLDVADGQVDAGCFERLVETGRDALARGDPEESSRALHEALDLWRGDVLADLDHPRFAETAAARLDELHLGALESRVDADLARGRHVEIVGELEALTRDHPFRERFRSRLMLALYRSDRQADALQAFREGRRILEDELGLAPGPELRALETAVLRQDPALAPPRIDELRTEGADASTLPAVFDVVRRAPMVGRQQQRERLESMWGSVRAQGRRVALVSGEAGAGKTRLVAELAALADHQGGTVLVGHGEQAALVPYQPVTEALHDHPDVAAVLAETPDPVRRALAALLGRATVRQPSDGRPTNAVAVRDDQLPAMLRAVDELLGRLARRAPTLFVVEDAERIDRASARLLGHLAQRLPERTLLVLCFRDPPGSAHLPLLDLVADLESHGLADRVVLDPLPEQEVGALVTAYSGGTASAGFVHALWSATGGNAFFAREVVRDLVSRGVLGVVEEVAAVPAAVRDVLGARLRELPGSVREVVEGAAVLGREVEVGLLADVVALPPAAVAKALEHAAASGLLVEVERSDAARFAFRHRLMLNAVGATIPAGLRQQLHLRAAQALGAAASAGPARLAAVAVHLRAAGSLVDPERAAGASLRAADEVASYFAWDEAVAHAEAAVGILVRAGAPPQRQAQACLRTADLLVRQSRDLARAIEHLHRALEHYRVARDRGGVAATRARLGHVLALHHSVMDIPAAREHLAAAEVALPDGEDAFEVLWARSMADMFALRTDDGCAAAHRAVAVASALDRPDLVAAVRPTEATHELHRGRLGTARRLLASAWETAGDRGDPHLAWEVVLAAALTGNVYLLDPVDAESWARRGLAQHRLETVALAHEGVSDHLACALAEQGRLEAARAVSGRLSDDTLSRRLLLLLSGEWEAAERAWSAAIEHDLDHGDLLDATVGASWLARVRSVLGRPEQAVTALYRAMTTLDVGRHLPAEVSVRADLALRLTELGEHDEARRHLGRCDELLAGSEDWRGRAGHVELARAAVAAAREDHVAAEAARASALRTFEAYRLPWWRLQALLAGPAPSTAPGAGPAGRDGVTQARRLLGSLAASDRWRGLLPATP